MKIHLGTDHAGYELKEAVKARLEQEGHEVIDHGALTYDPADDYPQPCIDCAQGVMDDPGSLGFVFGGSGNGEQIAANRVKGCRAALIWSTATAQLARQHNNAQVAAIGARQHTIEEGVELAVTFVNEPFSNDERHQRRIDYMTAYDEEHHR